MVPFAQNYNNQIFKQLFMNKYLEIIIIFSFVDLELKIPHD